MTIPGNVFSRLMYKDLQDNPVNIAADSKFSFSQMYDEQIIIQPNTNFWNLPFPQGVTLAQFIAVFSMAMSDLMPAVIYNQQAALPLPVGRALFFYQANGLWLSSVIGGQCRVVIGV